MSANPSGLSGRVGLHKMIAIPQGKTVGDLLPAFSDVVNEIHIGTPNPECASCRKPFSPVRKRRKALRMYPLWVPEPMAFSFDICGRCVAMHERGGASRDAVLASVESYCEGTEAKQ